jgi:hypothetical protein
MDYQTVECLGTLLIAIIAAGGWFYRRIKSSPPRPSSPRVQSPIPPPSITPSQPAKARWVPLSFASAAAAFVAVNIASIGAAIWISVRPGMPPDMGEGMGYAAGLFICLAGPPISVVAGGLSAIIHRLVKEFQARDLPLRAHVALGALVGLVSTLIPAGFLAASA